jgi:hypothetical protein
VKERTTVNGLIVSYDEETDEVTFKKKGSILTLKMGEDRLNLLYQMTPYYRYKKFLFMEQDGKCASCGAEFPYKRLILHHDPKLGTEDARYIDFKHLTKNRLLCKECHNKI